jgi:hypothetical protein
MPEPGAIFTVIIAGKYYMYPLKCLRLFLSSLEDGNKDCHECLIYRTYLGR